MAAYREVILTIDAVRHTDLVVAHGGTYKLEEWHMMAAFTTLLNGALDFCASTDCYAKLQKIDLEDGDARTREGNPIYVKLGRSDALRVLVPVGD